MSTQIIAEVGLNHMGRPLYLLGSYLHKLCLMANDLDAVTVQVREPAFYAQGATERSLELKDAVYEQLAKHLRMFSIGFGVALCDIGKLGFFESIGADFYKVLSKDMNDHELIKALVETEKPVWVSTGLASQEEVHELSRRFCWAGNLALIHTQLSYKNEEANLRAIPALQRYGRPVAFGLHSTDADALLLSLAFSPAAAFVYVKDDAGTKHRDEDHAVRLEQFPALVGRIRKAEAMLGDGVKKGMSNTIPDQQ